METFSTWKELFFFFKDYSREGKVEDKSFPRKPTIKVNKIDKNHFGVLEINQRGERKGGHKLPVSGMKQGLSITTDPGDIEIRMIREYYKYFYTRELDN